ncbi:MAG: hypothetical protein JWM95_661 [Gemmatimonadetes bacterium]|nr:hypothetical protein [Gemmatimonadota bacterium]
MKQGRTLTAFALGLLCATPAGAQVRSAIADTSGQNLVPGGFGNLKLTDIAIQLQFPDVTARFTPLDESVIRTLSRDSYHSLKDLVDSKRADIVRLAAQHGLRKPSLWYGEFYGLAPDARFSPLELTISSAGRDYRAVEVIPMTPGFGEQRLTLRGRQSAIYLFEDELAVNQDLTVSLGSQRSTAWGDKILRAVEQERALIRSRAAAAGTPPAP